MRLRERELVQACLVKRIRKPDALGGCPEAFSEERIPFRASLLPENGELQTLQRGLHSGKKIRLLSPSDLDAQAGDGVYVGEDFYIVQSVQRWLAHRELICGART